MSDGKKNNEVIDEVAPVPEQELPPYVESDGDSNDHLPQPAPKESSGEGSDKEASSSLSLKSRSSSGDSIKRKVAELDGPVTRAGKKRLDASSFVAKWS